MFPVIDMHCDTISMILQAKKKGEEIALRSNDKSVALDKMKEGGYMCQNFALFTFLQGRKLGSHEAPANTENQETPFEHVLQLSDTLDEQLALNADLVRPAYSAADIEKNFKDGFLSGLKTVEEGAVYEASVDNLKTMYDKGVRMSTLTWNFENDLAFPNKMIWHEDTKVMEFAPDTENGLKKAGFEMIEAMEELGIIIDVSHLSDAGIFDILKAVKKDTPVIASHSNARAIASHPRNLTDEMLRQMADHGGITGINFAYDFISDEPMDPQLTKVTDMIRHMKHIKNVAGIDMIGLGSDFDGIENEVEATNASKMQIIAEGMSREGFTNEEIEKVFYKNALRVYKTVIG